MARNRSQTKFQGALPLALQDVLTSPHPWDFPGLWQPKFHSLPLKSVRLWLSVWIPATPCWGLGYPQGNGHIHTALSHDLQGLCPPLPPHLTPPSPCPPLLFRSSGLLCVSVTCHGPLQPWAFAHAASCAGTDLPHLLHPWVLTSLCSQFRYLYVRGGVPYLVPSPSNDRPPFKMSSCHLPILHSSHPSLWCISLADNVMSTCLPGGCEPWEGRGHLSSTSSVSTWHTAGAQWMLIEWMSGCKTTRRGEVGACSVPWHHPLCLGLLSVSHLFIAWGGNRTAPSSSHRKIPCLPSGTHEFAQEWAGATCVYSVWNFQGQVRIGWRKQSWEGRGCGAQTGRGRKPGPSIWGYLCFSRSTLGFSFPSSGISLAMNVEAAGKHVVCYTDKETRDPLAGTLLRARESL